MSTPDFTFAWESASASEGPWAHLHVVRFEGREELSALYRYDVTLVARTEGAELDPHELVGARATLRIATLTAPAFKLVHGVVVEAEELGAVPEGMLYRAVLMPPLVRAQHRTRCRIFLRRTTREIINAVLQGDPHLAHEDGAAVLDDVGDMTSFETADEKFCWRIEDPTRIDDRRVRPYCVQYNESDLAFVARLLEDEGISYHFENGAGACVLVLSDTDQGKARLDPFDPLGSHVSARHIGAVKLGARLREKKVRLGDYDWRKPKLDLGAEAKGDADDLFAFCWPGGYADEKRLGEQLARARLDRYSVEAEYATMSGTGRVLSAGAIFRLEHEKDRYEGESLVTRLDVRGEQHGAATVNVGAAGEHPYTSTFECARRGHGGAPAESRFRPARRTPRPRIAGSQTAFVTDEPSSRGAEIHVGGPEGAEIGCVRLRFHWDTDEDRLAKEPSSCWVRVSQVFAGAGEGALWHPRVGCEVIVDHLDGDPDRPIVTGRVYNGQNRPPGPASGAATVSILRSCASPGKGVHNEFGFDDTAGSEQVKMHAGKDWNSTVGHDRTEKIANNSTSEVGVDRTESTGSNRKTSVDANNTETIGADEAVTIAANQTLSVGSNQAVTVGADQIEKIGASLTLTVGADRKASIAVNDALAVGANQEASVGANRKASVGGNQEESIGGNRVLGIGGSSAETVTGSRSVSVTGAMSHAVTGAVTISGAAAVKQTAGAAFEIASGGPTRVAAGTELVCSGGAKAALQAPDVFISAGGSITLSAGGATIKLSGAGVEIAASAIKIAGGSVDVSGSPVKLN
ncbi:VgrG protein [Minicystis rosea]|nr:VgrG protein [Minicystis rosea]